MITLLAILATAPATAQVPVYRLYDLADLVDPAFGYPGVGVAINGEDEVLANLLVDTAYGIKSVPTVWHPVRGMRQLAYPGFPDQTRGAFANDLNDNGTVVGVRWFGVPGPGDTSIPMLWRSGDPRDFDDLPLPATVTPTTVSDDDRYVGVVDDGTPASPFVFDTVTGSSVVLELPGHGYQPGINTVAAVNASGVFAGTLMGDDYIPRAYRYHPSFGVRPLDDVSPTAWTTEALDINDRGVTVGAVSDYLDRSPAVWARRDGVSRDLGLFPGELEAYATAVNNDNVVVGSAPNDHPLGRDTGWLYTQGEFHPLDCLLETPLGGNWKIWRAMDINDHGHILAEITTTTGTALFHTVVLRQVGTQPAPASCDGGVTAGP